MQRYGIVIAALCLTAAPALVTAQDENGEKNQGQQKKQAEQQSQSQKQNEKQSQGDPSSLESQKQKLSYAIGMTIARNIQRDGLDVEAELVAAGVRDVLSGGEARLTQQQVRDALQKLQQQMQQQQQAQQQEQQKKQAEERKKLAAENKKKGKKFLAENKQKEGVTELDSGLQYKVLQAGEGESPDADDVVTTRYKGTHLDGSVFDSTEGGDPATFPVDGVIQGWTEALQKMKVGSKWKLFIPSDLAYGEQGYRGAIEPNETLIFEVELLDVEDQQSQQNQGGGNSGN